MALSSEYQAVLDLLRRSAVEQYGVDREQILAPQQERLGLRSPQVAQLESEQMGGIRRQLMGTQADLTMRGVQRGEQLADTESQRKHEGQRALQDWFNQFQMQEKQQAGQMAMQDKQLAQQQSQFDQTVKMQKDQIKAQKDAERKNVIKNIVMMGANALTGGIMGAAQAGVGALQGAMLGGTGMAQLGATKNMFSHLMGQQGQDTGYNPVQQYPSMLSQQLFGGNKFSGVGDISPQSFLSQYKDPSRVSGGYGYGI